MTFNPITLFSQGLDRQGCGALGGLLGVCIYKLTGPIGVHIIGLSAVLIFGLLMFGLTPYSIYLYIRYFIHEAREKNARKVIEKENEEKVTTFKSKSKPTVITEEEENYATVKPDPYDRHHFVPDVDIDGTGKKESGKRLPENEHESTPVREDLFTPDEEEDEPPFDSAVKTETVTPTRVVKKSVPDFEGGSDKADLQGIFGDGANMEVINRFADEHERKNLEKSLENADSSIEITRTPVEEEPVEKKEYQFPPIALLKVDKTPKNENIRDELQTNATRLVETLKSFKVRTRIVNVSRGPAITRYELAPEEGVRVRQIANLVDDIALNLATTGVRVEAPIPGKAAVGIEVPNKTVSTVYLRELIETETFAKATSKLNVCLGIDVAGEPVFLDIAKMPHLLIAGATGMGKSVCINSIITSLLYKGTPDEIKLILIDPKKVELNIYNGLPHLLVPVVSDPKKAAGTLQWAVTEMERRFELIEEVGVRDVKNYNIVTKDDPEKEFLPQIVIIIDELADLMMTAPDDVEASICRLAQKARAAGMHIIIGTQRPSVDVITGLIKANVPSRIACTVASQTDSRVILDMAGAEKLIGRGDMLYAPVGAPKPRRVQGAFVSEGEVESVVSFIKEENGDVSEYNSDIIASIDRAAAACGSGKKGGSSGGFGAPDDASSEGGDPMLRAAIELALESDKISTSLIQRRLSLGYGRAAKLIDEMEKRGYVSPPEGQKPRRILITREQYMEMVINRSEELQ
ncbi:MAG: DNA translocase FtsK [Ruminococcaceae bacterium]|nr:DNA translocase FtsK [Oscillospiraceae bacterium]